MRYMNLTPTVALALLIGCAQPEIGTGGFPSQSNVESAPDMADYTEQYQQYCQSIGHAACGTSDRCTTDIMSDTLNCGGCGNVCPLGPNAAQRSCAFGHCVLQCYGDYADCDHNPTNGCETNLVASDPYNCGGCGIMCSSVLNNGGLTFVCQRGSCVAQCDLLQDDNSGNRYPVCNNRCVDALSIVDNCGGCGRKCVGDASCQDGKCVSCDGGRKSCSNRCVDVQTDIYNCGICGNTCVGSEKCVAGACTPEPTDGGATD